MSLKKIVKAINKYQRFLISSHVNLDGDAICSELVLAELLRSKGKTVYIVNDCKVPRVYKFLPKINDFKTYKKKDIYNFDVAILLDCFDTDRIGKVARLITGDKFVIVIDHHISNGVFADINWIKPDASSTNEMLYEIIKKMNYRINKDIAILLYIGILTDTGSFRYSNTSSYTHRIVGDLLNWKLPVNKIYRKIYESNPVSDIRLFVNLLKDFKLDSSGKIAWLKIKQKALPKNKVQIDLSEHILGFLRSIRGVEVALLFRKINNKNQVRVNFRSNDRVDVSKFAAGFGGGGHRAASGCTLKGGLKKVEYLVISKLKEVLKS